MSEWLAKAEEPLLKKQRQGNLPRSRSLTDRVFGEMKPGSVRGSIFTLTSSAIGAGALSLPLAVWYVGLIGGIVLIIICGLLAMFGLNTIVEASTKHHMFNLSELITKLWGTSVTTVLEITIILYTLGWMLAYLIIVGDTIATLMISMGFPESSLETYRTIAILVSVFLIILPLSLLKNLSGLRIVAIISIVTLLYITVVVCVEFPYYYDDNGLEGLVYFKLDSNFFTAFSLCMFSFLSHQNLPQIYSELFNRRPRRMKKVILRSVLIEEFFYLIMGTLGYMSTLDDTSTVVLQRGPPITLGFSWLMTVGRIFMGVTLVLAIPINIHPCRNNIRQIYFRIMRKERRTGLHLVNVIISVIVLTIITTLAICVANVLFIFNFLGGFCSAIICLMAPAMLFIKIEDSVCKRYTVMGVAVVCTLFGFTSVGFRIASLI